MERPHVTGGIIIAFPNTSDQHTNAITRIWAFQLDAIFRGPVIVETNYGYSYVGTFRICPASGDFDFERSRRWDQTETLKLIIALMDWCPVARIYMRAAGQYPGTLQSRKISSLAGYA